ncbi:hypothetical protein N8843_05655 [Verrucomicrobia bacterium]|nr:hypothetical protein [Verrucomicrobiota bacterium]MDA7628105.1 hypothetical protein [Verrucomicrobiota bacterium]
MQNALVNIDRPSKRIIDHDPIRYYLMALALEQIHSLKESWYTHADHTALYYTETRKLDAVLQCRKSSTVNCDG